MAQGLETLRLGRALLDPFRFGLFAWMLLSHKLCRWLVPWAAVAALLALAAASPSSHVARALLGLTGIVGIAAAVGWHWPESRPVPASSRSPCSHASRTSPRSTPGSASPPAGSSPHGSRPAGTRTCDRPADAVRVRRPRFRPRRPRTTSNLDRHPYHPPRRRNTTGIVFTMIFRSCSTVRRSM